MKQIDLEPDDYEAKLDHETLNSRFVFEIKPMSRWWFVPVIVFILAGALYNGIANPATWFLIMSGMFLAALGIFCFPKTWLSRIND